MLKKIWQSFMRWVRKTFGKGTAKTLDRRAAIAELPPLDDTDREYLFMQLLEGVAHGWQQPRAVGFFNKIKQRVRKSEWLEWLDRFGSNLLNTPAPNYELAGRMVQLSQLDCGEIGDLAGEYGIQLLERQAAENSAGMMPIVEFTGADEENPFGMSYGGSIEGNNIDWNEIPPELFGDGNFQSEMQSPPQSEQYAQTREITLEEFAAMLHKDPNLVAELAEQFGIETTDPQVIINAVIAQMQQQVQPISGDLNQNTPHEISVVPPSAKPPHIKPKPSVKPPVTNAMPAPPPPPKPKLGEYKLEDPWANGTHDSEQAQPETVNHEKLV
jgi:hypothetical protein